jgi:hypothetical protein
MKIIGVKFFYTIKEFAEPKEWRQVTILLADMYGQPDLQPQRTNKTRSAEGQVFPKRMAILLPIRRTKHGVKSFQIVPVVLDAINTYSSIVSGVMLIAWMRPKIVTCLLNSIEHLSFVFPKHTLQNQVIGYMITAENCFLKISFSNKLFHFSA